MLLTKQIGGLIFCMQINTKDLYRFIPYFVGTLGMPSVPKITTLQYLYKISRKKRRIKFIFCMEINIKVFYKFYQFWLSWLGMPKVPQNNNFEISLQYLKKKRGMKLIVCMKVNIKVCYKVIQAIIVGGCGQVYLKYPE